MTIQKIFYTWADIMTLCRALLTAHILTNEDLMNQAKRRGCLCVYGVPRGGIHVATCLQSAWLEEFPHTPASTFGDRTINGNLVLQLVTDPENADFFVDDIIDSGNTAKYHTEKYGKPFFALCRGAQDSWKVFPWETMLDETGPEQNLVRVLEFIGEDPHREGLKETPARIIKSWDTLFSGYRQNPETVFKVFEDGACDELVLLKNIEFYSTCEHHMLPFIGKAHIAYIPNGKVIGVSKLARLLEIFARRMQIQERIGMQITEALETYLQPKGAACILEAQHLCMTSRGVQKQDSIMSTSSLTGVLRESAAARAELLQLIKL